MMDPEPLAAHDSTPFENRLLSAARSETIPTEMKLRMSQGLNLGAAAMGGSGPAALLSLNTIALVVVGAAALAGLASVFLKQSGESHATGAAVAITDPARATSVEATAAQPAAVANPTSGPMELPAQAPHPAARGSQHGTSNASPTPATRKREIDLREEIGFLDTVRAALAAGAPAKALGILGQYTRRYPNGTFAPEALALRIEAIADTGDGEMARTLAHRFLQAHPDSPLAERVERLTGARR